MKKLLFFGLILGALLSAVGILCVNQIFIKSNFTGNITVTTTRCGFIVDAPIKSGYTHRADGCKQSNDYLEEIIVYQKNGTPIDRQHVTDKKLSGDVVINVSSDGKITEIADLENNPGGNAKQIGVLDENWEALPNKQLKRTAAKLRQQE